MTTLTTIPSATNADPITISTSNAAPDPLRADHPHRRTAARGHQSSRLDTICQRAVLSALGPMKRGRLSVRLPTGETRVFGGATDGPTATILVRRADFFRRCCLYGDIGFGEAYVDGAWETPDVTAVIKWFIANADTAPTLSGSRRTPIAVNLLSLFNRAKHLLRENTRSMSRQNIQEHYDLGNAFYELFLDPTMTYSCAAFDGDSGLDLKAAQERKYERMCRALRLQPGKRVLEIGTGWGGFSLHAARRHGCHVTSLTISENQYDHARKLAEQHGLSDRIEVKLCDYREAEGQFDRIVSIEMIEAVGDRYLDKYFAQCSRLLKPDGLLGIQAITCPDARYNALRRNVDWIQKHIFPGSLLPSIGRMNRAVEKTGTLFLHDLRDMGTSYVKTLQAWRERFNSRLDEVRALGFPEDFIRKWNYYFSYCEAAFAMRHISVVQAVYTRPNNPTLAEPAAHD